MRNWLRAARMELGMTQAQVAELSGICESAYCMIESGKRGCAVDTAKRIASVLGLDWTRFYEDDKHGKQ